MQLPTTSFSDGLQQERGVSNPIAAPTSDAYENKQYIFDGDKAELVDNSEY